MKLFVEIVIFVTFYCSTLFQNIRLMFRDFTKSKMLQPECCRSLTSYCLFNLFAVKNGANMLVKISGVEGDYLVKNESSITQYLKDEQGVHTGESVLHIITDSIENSEDRNEISKKIEEFNII